MDTMHLYSGQSNVFGAVEEAALHPNWIPFDVPQLQSLGGRAMPIDDAKRERRRTLLRAHLETENDHDLDRIMRTFSDRTVMVYNGRSFSDHEGIRWAHSYFGWSSVQGAFAGLRVVIEQEHFTDDEIVIESRLFGKHVGEFLGFPATGRDLELHAVGFYRFDRDGKLTSERTVMNLGPLAGELEPPSP